MYCASCGKPVGQEDRFCPHCGRVSLAWVEDKAKLLKERLPQHVQKAPFYPDAFFYAQYYRDPLNGLHYMASVIFSLLEIDAQGCVIDFCDEKEFRQHASADTAGLYTKVRPEGREIEVILINSRHKSNPLSVGAILAHEMMHLYLFRLNLSLPDTRANELLTDLATVITGLSILVLNGMAYSSEWWLTIIMAVFGRVYWRTHELAFGYYKPYEYGRLALSYFNERNIPVEDFLGYLSPESRHFVPKRRFLKAKASTEFIRLLEKRHRKSNVIKGAIAAAIVVPILVFAIVAEEQKEELNRSVQSCKSELFILEAKVERDANDLKHMDDELNGYKKVGDVDHYNSLVQPRNTLLGQVKQEVSDYEAKRAACNALVKQYNEQQ